MQIPDLKEAWIVSVENLSKILKIDLDLAASIMGALIGTLLIPVPFLGTLIGAIIGVSLVERK